MTDEELIAYLRLQGLDKDIAAADRIELLATTNEQLVATNEALSIANATLIAERDHWSGVARREGVCMTCRGPNGAPETYGCTDCLNTGYCGEHHSTVADLEAKLVKAVEALKYYAVEAMPWDADDSLIARTALAEIKSGVATTPYGLEGENHE